MNHNPYASPAPPYPAAHGSGMDNSVSTAAIDLLMATKPWVRFMSIFVFIGSAFLVLAAVGMLLIGGTGIALGGEAGALGGGMSIVIAVIYAAFAFLYIYPGLKLWKYADRIAALALSRESMDLEAALDQQRAFWKFVGIIALITVILYAVIILIAMVAAGAGAAMSGG